MSPSLVDTVDQIEAALQPLKAEIDGLQVVPFYLRIPTPPSIDIYPADPFQQPAGFDKEGRRSAFTVRARASTVDMSAGQQILLRLLDTTDPASVENALTWDGLDAYMVEGYPTGYRTYDDNPGELVGVEWRIEVLT